MIPTPQVWDREIMSLDIWSLRQNTENAMLYTPDGKRNVGWLTLKLWSLEQLEIPKSNKW